MYEQRVSACRYEKTTFQQEVQHGFDALQDNSWLILDASKSIADLQAEVSVNHTFQLQPLPCLQLGMLTPRTKQLNALTCQYQLEHSLADSSSLACLTASRLDCVSCKQCYGTK